MEAPHWSLDIYNRQAQLKAFNDKAPHKTIRADNPNWIRLTSMGNRWVKD